MDNDPDRPGNGANASFKPVSGDSNGKGKGKAKDNSISGRLLDSTKLAMHSLASSGGIQTRTAEGKGSASLLSSNNPLHTEQPSSAGPSSYRNDTQLGVQESIKRPLQPSQETSDAFNDFLQPSQHQVIEVGSSFEHSAADAQRSMDGNDVVNLLSLPDEELELEPDTKALSEEDMARLRHAFFSREYSTQQWDSLLNFVPDFISKPEESYERAQYIGTSDPVEARDTWFKQWEDVLSSYTDEVWGDLGPLVAAAKAEINEAQDPTVGSQETGTKALSRLRQILAHVRGSE